LDETDHSVSTGIGFELAVGRPIGNWGEVETSFGILNAEDITKFNFMPFTEDCNTDKQVLEGEITSKLSIISYGADFIAYYPEWRNWKPLGVVGVRGRYVTTDEIKLSAGRSDINLSYPAGEQMFGFRWGLGLRYVKSASALEIRLMDDIFELTTSQVIDPDEYQIKKMNHFWYITVGYAHSW
jgi:hypothetical protein